MLDKPKIDDAMFFKKEQKTIIITKQTKKR